MGRCCQGFSVSLPLIRRLGWDSSQAFLQKCSKQTQVFLVVPLPHVVMGRSLRPPMRFRAVISLVELLPLGERHQLVPPSVTKEDRHPYFLQILDRVDRGTPEPAVQPT